MTMANQKNVQFDFENRVFAAEQSETENAIRETYRFAAQHFVQTDDWSVSV